MKSLIVVYLMMISATVSAYGPSFPIGPNPRLTPGKLCDRPRAYRYPERIAYCDRDVTYETKEFLIQKYDQELGYNIRGLTRTDFKIDHLIPLCAGGSNDESNLWPQHKSIYYVTDAVEPLICAKMMAGKLRQSDAVKLVMRAKANLKQVNDVINLLQKM